MSAYTHHGECSIQDPCLRCKEFGETSERERIIAILESVKVAEDGCFSERMPDTLIALIKGDVTE